MFRGNEREDDRRPYIALVYETNRDEADKAHAARRRIEAPAFIEREGAARRKLRRAAVARREAVVRVIEGREAFVERRGDANGRVA